MKTKIFLFAVLFIAMAQVWAQSNNQKGTVISRIPLLGETAPSFTAQSTNGTIEFPADYESKWKIIISHPADFTPVCTSEIMELALMQQDFKDLNCALLVVSTDDLERHKGWEKGMEEMLAKDKNNEPVKIKFPLVDDSKMSISWQYGMINPSVDSRHAVRGVFIIDPDNKIQSISFYPLNVGRNLDELKRTLIALQTAKKNTVLTPVNWQPGKDVLLPYPKSVDYYTTHQGIEGYMIYSQIEK
jgi:peroxiredoxin (alkyl hydroperoxide reductase subunit C)